MPSLSYPRALILGLGLFAFSLIEVLYNALVPPLLAGFGLTAATIGLAMTLDNWLSLFVQPWAGARSDRTRTALGRRIPFILIGGPLAALGFSLIPIAPNIPFILGGMVLTYVGLSIFRAPTVALLGDLYPSERRSQAHAFMQFVAAFAFVLALFFGGTLFSIQRGLPLWVFSTVLLVALGLLILLLPQARYTPPAVDSEKQPGLLETLRSVFNGDAKLVAPVLLSIFFWFMSYNIAQTFFTLYAKTVLGLETGNATQLFALAPFAGLVIAIPSGFLSGRLGRRRVVLPCLSVVMASQFGMFLFPNLTYVSIAIIVNGAMWTTVSINALPMIFESASSSRMGGFTGLYFLTISLASIVAPPLAGQVVDLTGTYRSIFAVTPVFVFLGMVFLARAPKVEASRLPSVADRSATEMGT